MSGVPGVDLPVEAGRSVELFLTAVDELAPGLVAGFYLVGSVALGDFHPRGAGRGRLSTASDIDFVAVTDRRLEPESREMAGLAEAHARTLARFPRPDLDGAVLTWTDLAAGPDSCPDVPCALESRFTPAGRSGINPVTFCELAWQRQPAGRGRGKWMASHCLITLGGSSHAPIPGHCLPPAPCYPQPHRRRPAVCARRPGSLLRRGRLRVPPGR